jgi:hypothetical protein
VIYKVSYAVIGKPHLGMMIDQDTAPQVGERIPLGTDDEVCEIIEVQDLMPPMGDFAYLHVTCKPVEAA